MQRLLLSSKSLWLGILVACFLLAVTSPAWASAGKATMTAEQIKDVWMKTYGNINSMKVAYSVHLIEEKLDLSPHTIHKGKRNKHTFVEKIEQRPRYSIRISNAESRFANSKDVTSHSFDGKLVRGYEGSTNIGEIDLGDSWQRVGSKNHMARYLLIGEYRPYIKYWPKGETTLERLLRRYPNYSVRPELEVVAGQSCHVVDLSLERTDSLSRKFSIWFAHEKGMLVMKFQDDIDDDYTSQRIVEKIGSTKTRSGLVWYPLEVRSFERNPAFETTYSFVVQEFVPNVRVSADSFRLKFPEGAHVADFTAGYHYKVKNDRPADVTVLGSSVAAPDESVIESLNRTLHGKSSFGIDFPFVIVFGLAFAVGFGFVFGRITRKEKKNAE